MVKTIRVMEDYIGQRFDAVMGVETGGSNALQPLVAIDVPAAGGRAR